MRLSKPLEAKTLSKQDMKKLQQKLKPKQRRFKTTWHGSILGKMLYLMEVSRWIWWWLHLESVLEESRQEILCWLTLCSCNYQDHFITLVHYSINFNNLLSMLKTFIYFWTRSQISKRVTKSLSLKKEE